MSTSSKKSDLNIISQDDCRGCCSSRQPQFAGLSRRNFLQGIGAAGAVLAVTRAPVWGATADPVPADQPFPRGKPLRVKPILVFDVPNRGDRTSWRNYGAIHTPEAAQEEVGRIKGELEQLQRKATGRGSNSRTCSWW